MPASGRARAGESWPGGRQGNCLLQHADFGFDVNFVENNWLLFVRKDVMCHISRVKIFQ